MASHSVGWRKTAALAFSQCRPRISRTPRSHGRPSALQASRIHPRSLFSWSGRSVPAKVTTDEVIPMHYFDDTKVTRGMILSFTMKFDEVLDPDMLHVALLRLLNHGDWRKMGGRLRLNKSGKIDIHIPRPFTPTRPAVRYSHAEFDTSIKDHPLASKIPKRTNGPSMQTGADAFRPLCCREGVPTRIQDNLYSDEPQVQLHIVSFNDATLVSLSWPHTMTDLMGRQAFLKAWSLVLAGKDGEVPPFQGLKEDPLADFGITKPSTSWLFEPLQLEGLKVLYSVWRYVLTIAIRPTTEMRMIFLPSKTIRKLHQEALNQLPSTDVNGNKTFLSEGDVLTAWTTQTACQHMARTSKHNVLIVNMFDLRSRLPGVFRPGDVYVQNASFPCLTILPINKIRKSSLGSFAMYMRQSMLDQVSEKQVRALAWLFRQAYDKTSKGPFFGVPNSLPVCFTNWSMGKLFDVVDFAPAVVKTRQKIGGNAGKPVYIHAHPLGKKQLTTRNAFNILGKDDEGNYWMSGIVRPSVWATFEKEIERLQEPEKI